MFDLQLLLKKKKRLFSTRDRAAQQITWSDEVELPDLVDGLEAGPPFLAPSFPLWFELSSYSRCSIPKSSFLEFKPLLLPLQRELTQQFT